MFYVGELEISVKCLENGSVEAVWVEITFKVIPPLWAGVTNRFTVGSIQVIRGHLN